MSPEEFTLGAVIDEVTNVYTMGATAFALFGGEKDRSIEKWRLNEALYEVALKAVSDDRGKRQQSILEFKHEWEATRLE
jgi:serine/threonine-protein kinase